MRLLRSLETFAAVAESRNFSEAAQKLRLTPSAVSKQIAALEQEMNVSLVLRNTHSLALTDAGTIFLDRAQRIISEIAEAKHMLGGYSDTPRGMLRVATPATFGRVFVSPIITNILELYPDLRIELRLSERLADPVTSGVDIAIRIGSLEDSNLIANKLAPFRRIVCASPQYLERSGYPERPEDLAKHNCLVNIRYGARNTWYFVRKGVTRKTVVSGTFSANNSGALIDAVLGGLGVGLAGTWLASSYIESGQLVPLLPGWTARTTREAQDISAFYPKSTYKSPAVRAFIDFLRNDYGAPPRWDAPLIRDGAIINE
jgi:DNA-binding transcriptional LysR family regulator